VRVIEKETEVARHQSGRNSGVLHAGIYYRPGSLKARLCREGKRELEAFADTYDVAWRRTGKLIVALDAGEARQLAELERRARANGVPGLRRLDSPRELAAYEPCVRGHAGLWCGDTGVIDFRALAQRLLEQVTCLLLSCSTSFFPFPYRSHSNLMRTPLLYPSIRI
jgi:L-2-hydroxyglutarate oxidase